MIQKSLWACVSYDVVRCALFFRSFSRSSRISNAYLIRAHPLTPFSQLFHSFSHHFSSCCFVQQKLLPFVSFSACIPIKLLRKNGGKTRRKLEKRIFNRILWHRKCNYKGIVKWIYFFLVFSVFVSPALLCECGEFRRRNERKSRLRWDCECVYSMQNNEKTKKDGEESAQNVSQNSAFIVRRSSNFAFNSYVNQGRKTKRMRYCFFFFFF